MKLYKRVSRFAYRKLVSKKDDSKLKWAFGLKGGDRISVNGILQIVLDVFPVKRFTKRGWMITDIEILTPLSVGKLDGVYTVLNDDVRPVYRLNIIQDKMAA